ALDGLPEDFVADHPAADDGLVAITTEYPDVIPFMTYSRDREARLAVAMEYFNLAWPENETVLHDLLKLRQEKAHLVGYADWPDFDAELKMIGKGAAIAEFIERITSDSADAGRRERAVLAERGAQDGIDDVD